MVNRELAQAVSDLGADGQGDAARIQRSELETRSVIDAADAAELDLVLDFLSPETNAQGYIATLAARSRLAKAEDSQLILARFVGLLPVLDAERASLLPHRFAQLCRHASRLACNAGPASALGLVGALRKAVTLANADWTQLNPVQADFLATCIMARAYEVALPLAETRFAFVHSSGVDTLEASDVLLICYYKGLVFLGMKRFEEALSMFNLVFTVPAHNSTTVHLLAYKKLHLVSEIVDGAPPVFVKYALAHTRRLSNQCTPYNALSTALRDRDIAKVREVIGQHRQAYERDENFGLVKQVENSFCRRQVARLTSTFCRLSLHDVAVQSGLADAQAAEKLIRTMVAQGQLRALIDQRLSMVSFDDDQGDPKMFSEEFHEQKVQESLQCLAKISQYRDGITSDPWFREREQAAKDRNSKMAERDQSMMKDRDDDEF